MVVLLPSTLANSLGFFGEIHGPDFHGVGPHGFVGAHFPPHLEPLHHAAEPDPYHPLPPPPPVPYHHVPTYHHVSYDHGYEYGHEYHPLPPPHHPEPYHHAPHHPEPNLPAPHIPGVYGPY